jgi:hypothetical protein
MYAFNLLGVRLASRGTGHPNVSALAGLAATHLGCGLRLSGCVVFVRELAVNVNHLCTSRDIELIFRSTCGTLNDSDACTLGQRDLDSILTADRAGEDRGEFFLHDPDDTPTSTTHANPAARMGDLPLISTFHASLRNGRARVIKARG